jgi:hypothetical protein
MATSKQCSKCKEVKGTEEFYRATDAKDGLQSWCRACSKAAESQRVRKKPDPVEPPPFKVCLCCNIEKPSAVFPRHSWTKDGLHMYCKACTRKKALDSRAKWTPEQRAAHLEKLKKYNKTPAQREKQRARSKSVASCAAKALNAAVTCGLIEKADRCQGNGIYGVPCVGSPVTAHHHKGYDLENWFDVEWLCRPCHCAADRKRRDDGLVSATSENRGSGVQPTPQDSVTRR